MTAASDEEAPRGERSCKLCNSGVTLSNCSCEACKVWRILGDKLSMKRSIPWSNALDVIERFCKRQRTVEGQNAEPGVIPGSASSASHEETSKSKAGDIPPRTLELLPPQQFHKTRKAFLHRHRESLRRLPPLQKRRHCQFKNSSSKASCSNDGDLMRQRMGSVTRTKDQRHFRHSKKRLRKPKVMSKIGAWKLSLRMAMNIDTVQNEIQRNTSRPSETSRRPTTTP